MAVREQASGVRCNGACSGAAVHDTHVRAMLLTHHGKWQGEHVHATTHLQPSQHMRHMHAHPHTLHSEHAMRRTHAWASEGTCRWVCGSGVGVCTCGMVLDRLNEMAQAGWRGQWPQCSAG